MIAEVAPLLHAVNHIPRICSGEDLPDIAPWEQLQLPAPFGIDFDTPPEMVLNLVEAALRPMLATLYKARMTPMFIALMNLDTKLMWLIHRKAHIELTPDDMMVTYGFAYHMSTGGFANFLYDKYMPACFATTPYTSSCTNEYEGPRI